ncbi:spore wall protein 2-like isoform X2 [Haliotis rufescens]|uniref:spore wall protein 2-like isoform X2 n=1 Tax=Haliotis rufescens TaxID=6454 RepID=UPI00201E9C0F|nr:spore wall protein 2-like isoform X2 [Haliotis rufescens]
MSDGDTRDAQDKTGEHSEEGNSRKVSKEEDPAQRRDSADKRKEEKDGAKSDRKNSSDRKPDEGNRQEEQTDTESASALDAHEPESGQDWSNTEGGLPNTGSKPVSKDNMDESKVSVGSEVEQKSSAEQGGGDELGDHVEDAHSNSDERENSSGKHAEAANSSNENGSHDSGSPNALPDSEKTDTEKEADDTGQVVTSRDAKGDNHVGEVAGDEEGGESGSESENDDSGDEENEADDVTAEISQAHSKDPNQSQENRSEKEETNNRVDETTETGESQAAAQEHSSTADNSVSKTADDTTERRQSLTEKSDSAEREAEIDGTENNRMDTNDSDPSKTQSQEETPPSGTAERSDVRSEHSQPQTEDPNQLPEKRSHEGDTDSGAGLDEKESCVPGQASQSRGDESRGEDQVIINSDDRENSEELQETSGSNQVDERPGQRMENGHSNQDSEIQQGSNGDDTDETLQTRRLSENESHNVIGADSTEADNTRENAEEDQSESWQRDGGTGGNQESSSLDGRKKDENGDFEFETSSLSQTEGDTTRGQPPISTVYVKAPRRQSDQDSDSTRSQDEIEIVSQANRQDGDQQETQNEENGSETDTTKQVGAEIEEKGEAEVEEKEEVEVKQEVQEDIANDDGEQGEVGVNSDVKAEEMAETEDPSEVVNNGEAKDNGGIGKDVEEDGEVGERDKAENGEVGKEEVEVEHRKESVAHDSVKDDNLDKEVKVESEVTNTIEGVQDRVEGDDEDESGESEEEEDSSSEEDDETGEDSEDDIEDDKTSALVPGNKTIESTEVQAGQQTESENTRKESTVSENPPPAATKEEPGRNNRGEANVKDEEKGVQPEEDRRISIKGDSKSIRSTHSAQSRGSVGQSRQSLRASRISVEKHVKPEVLDTPVDAAQAPGPRGDEEEQDKKSVATSRASLTERGTGEEDAKADSKSIVSQDRNEKDDTTIHTDVTDNANNESQQHSDSKTCATSQEKEPVRETKNTNKPTSAKQVHHRQEKKNVPRGRTAVVSPQRSTSSPQRGRGSYGSEVRSARRSPRETSRSQTRSPTRPRTTMTSRSSKDPDGRSKQREFFREELKRLEGALKREKSKIIKPEVKKHTPYIFNTLEPYYNTSTVRYLVELPEEVQHRFVSRKTAIGLCDPWVDYSMDTKFLPRISTSARAVNRQQEMEKRDEKIRDREKRSKKEGSTRLPKFPVVTLDSKELATKPLYYSDVPELRRELRDKYSQNATKKIDEDYTRTKQDFYRMDLDKLDEVHPLNRPHMRNAYFAYLQNTPGSRKAVVECVKGLKAEGKAN